MTLYSVVFSMGFFLNSYRQTFSFLKGDERNAYLNHGSTYFIAFQMINFSSMDSNFSVNILVFTFTLQHKKPISHMLQMGAFALLITMTTSAL